MSGWHLDSPQFLYLYLEHEALTGKKSLVDMIPVGDNGEFTLPYFTEDTESVVELESPPFKWTVIVSKAINDTLILHKPANGPTKLKGVPAKYSLSSAESPLSEFENFKKRTAELDYLSAYDRMAQSGAVGGAKGLVDNKYLDSLDAVFHAEYSSVIERDLISKSQYYTDLVIASGWRWRREAGEKSDVLRSDWRELDGHSNGRTLAEKIKSPGWVQAWAEVHYDWFEADKQLLNSYVLKGDLDSIAYFLGSTEEEALLAMWWWDLNNPSQMTSGWWARYSNTKLGQMRLSSLKNEDLFTSKTFQGMRWTTPSTDVEYVDELYGLWTAIIIVKSESIASLREWGAFRGISESIRVKRNDVRFVALCIDGDEKKWSNILKMRNSTSEIVRWVGADARWLNGLDVQSVPQVVIVSPSLEIHSYSAPLPSLGLRKYLENLPR